MIQVSVERKRVIQACKNFLAAREEKIKQRTEELIRDEMSPRTGWMAFLNLIMPPAKTREIALARLNKTPGGAFQFSPIEHLHIRGGLWANEAKKMLDLCEASNMDFVVLDADSQWILKHE